MKARAKLAIDVVADPACPWCFVGCERLDAALAKFPEVEAEVVYLPYLLDDKVARPSVPLRPYMRKKHGEDPSPSFARAEREALVGGVKLDFTKVEIYPNTVAAQTLVRHSHGRGTQRALMKALFRAYFLDAEDIGRPEILLSIAAEHGFGRQEARTILADERELAQTQSDAVESQRQGVTAVPFFVFEQRDVLMGLQTAKILEKLIERFVVART